MRRYTITFGGGHFHPITGEDMFGKYVQTPELDSHQTARDWAFERFGKQWAFDYDSPEEAGADRYDMTEVPWGSSEELRHIENERWQAVREGRWDEAAAAGFAESEEAAIDWMDREMIEDAEAFERELEDLS